MSDTATEHTVTLRLICADRPPPIDRAAVFGMLVQGQVLEAGTPQSDGSLRWECDVRVRGAAGDMLRFKGSCVHGTVPDPFLYLGFAPVDEPRSWIRRWKIELTTIRWDNIEAVVEEEGAVLEATVTQLRGTRPPLRDGGWVVRSPAPDAP
jgi:hypothetical protein